MAQYSSGTKTMAKRSEIKINDILKSRRRNQFENTPEELNTDIENVIYDETKLNRKFHQVKAANVKEKQAWSNQQILQHIITIISALFHGFYAA